MLVQRDSSDFGLGRVRRKGAFGQTGPDCGFDQVPGRDYFTADVYARRVYGVDDRGQSESQVSGRRFERGDRFRVSGPRPEDRKSTRLNSSRLGISYAVFCLKKKK